MNVQPVHVYPDLLAAADLLLVSERPAVFDMALPSKLTSYFAAGRPILAVVSPEGATAREVRRSGGGIVVRAGDIPALLAAIEQLKNDRPLAVRLAAAGRTYAARELSREAAFTRLDGFVRILVSGAAAPIGTPVMAIPEKRAIWKEQG
jgi:colanic acid biosynthesis glycosyl transferase WcaI